MYSLLSTEDFIEQDDYSIILISSPGINIYAKMKITFCEEEYWQRAGVKG